jgi:hypothetical protein
VLCHIHGQYQPNEQHPDLLGRNLIEEPKQSDLTSHNDWDRLGNVVRLHDCLALEADPEQGLRIQIEHVVQVVANRVVADRSNKIYKQFIGLVTIPDVSLVHHEANALGGVARVRPIVVGCLRVSRGTLGDKAEELLGGDVEQPQEVERPEEDRLQVADSHKVNGTTRYKHQLPILRFTQFL